ncbi:complex I subunit 4 family protein [Planctomicrobium sp. SH661]|uniref:complex I subunit 4 family protein n=1 Tax=Planctomicrobium sp. SH661 TaxID=3448124 RepID=UPI003F5B5271
MVSLLFISLAIPLLTALSLMLFRSSLTPSGARATALVGAVATLFVSLQLLNSYTQLPKTVTPGAPIQPQVQYQHPWLTLGTPNAEGAGQVQLELHFGLDGISVALIVLTTLLTCSSILISWEVIRDRAAEFYTALMILEAGLIGVFCAFDVVLFYVFFELTLIPLFFLIAIWGGTERRHAAVKFFLYTLAGSLVTLLGVISLILHVSAAGLTTPCSIPALASWLQAHPLSPEWQTALFLAISAGFLIKVPVFPFHTWLPLAHVEAPTAGSVLLAGVLLKLGTYGFLRLCLPMFPEACLSLGLPAIGFLSVIGIIYGSLCALAQRDLKKLVAYSSVAHLGFCTLGLFALNVEGVTGSVLQMVNHGLSTGALFLLVGMVYDRYHTRQLDELSGLAGRLPFIGCSMVFISMASIGLPGLNGFVGEVLCLGGMFKQHTIYAVFGALGVVLGAWYLLSALQVFFFGPLKESEHREPNITDMNLREMCAFLPLALACLWIGVQPGPLVDLIRPDIESVTALYQQPVQTELAQDQSLNHSVAATQASNPMKAQRSLLSGNGN